MTRFHVERLAAPLLALLVSCASSPWKGERADELNLALEFDRNVPVVRARVNGVPRRLVVGTAQSVSLLHSAGDPAIVALGEKRTVRLHPLEYDLSPLADGLLGLDAWRGTALTIDYEKSLLTVHSSSPEFPDAIRFRYRGIPTLPVVVDGRRYTAVLDAALPDSLVLPGREKERRNATVTLAAPPRRIDILVTPAVDEAHVGSRLLADYLVTIDTRKKIISLWRYGREPLAAKEKPLNR